MEKTVNVSIRITPEIHTFLKKMSFDKNISMNAIILNCLQKFKKKEENKLT